MSARQLASLVDGRSARRGVRFTFVAFLAVTLLLVGHSFLTYDPVGNTEDVEEGVVAANDTTQRPADGPLVVAMVDGVSPGQIVAYDANGSAVYHNESWSIYHDVDPSPRSQRTVTYVASGTASEETCSSTVWCRSSRRSSSTGCCTPCRRGWEPSTRPCCWRPPSSAERGPRPQSGHDCSRTGLAADADRAIHGSVRRSRGVRRARTRAAVRTAAGASRGVHRRRPASPRDVRGRRPCRSGRAPVRSRPRRPPRGPSGGDRW